MPSLNREQRRAAKFGRHRSVDEGPWPESAPNPALGGAIPTAPGAEAGAGQPDPDEAREPGPGPDPGDATDQAGRVPRRSVSAKNSAQG
jgi:hypothetical protein